MINKNKTVIISSILIIGIIYQIWQLWPRITYDITESRRVILKHSMWRNAYFHRSESLANNIQFLNKYIPAKATVMLPPDDVLPNTLGNTIEMPFYLQFRPVVKCNQYFFECVNEYGSSGAYAFFSGDMEKKLEKNNIDQNRIIKQGPYQLISPPQGNTSSVLELTDFNNVWEIAAKLLLPILFLLILTFIGYLLVNSVLTEWEILPKIAIGYGLSLGFYSLFIFAWLFISREILSYQIIFECLIIMASIFITISWILGKTNPNINNNNQKFRLDIWQTLFILIFLFQLFISIGKAYSGIDEIRNWAIRGYAIAEYSLIDGTSNYGALTTAFPPHLHILIAVFKKMFTESVPESKIIFPIYGFMLLLLIYDYLKKRTPPPISGLAVIFTAFIPNIYMHFNKGFANLPATFFFITSLILLLNAIKTKDPRKRTIAYSLSSIFLIFIAWTRSEGAAIGVVMVLLITLIWGRILSNGKWGLYFLLFILPFALFVAFWQYASGVIYSYRTLDQNLFGAILSDMFRGRFHFSTLIIILKVFISYITSGSLWGSVATTGILFLLIGIVNRKISWSKVYHLLPPFVYLLMVFFAYYASAFVVDTAAGRVHSGLLRLIMPAMISGWILLIAMIFQNVESVESDNQSLSPI